MSTISKILPAPPNNFSTTLSADITAAALSIGLNSITGLGSEGVGVIYKKKTDGTPDETTVEFVHWTGLGTNTITLTDTGDRGISGSYNGAQAHSNGDTFEVWVHSSYYPRDFALVEHAADGTHDPTKVTTRTAFETEHKTDNTHDSTKVAMLAGEQTLTGQKTFSGGIKTDTIAEVTTGAKTTISNGIKTDTVDEKTADAGVTVDGCLIKDGNVAKATILSTTAKAAAYVSASQTISSNTWTKVNFDTEHYDPGNNFDTTNKRFTAPVAGYYLITSLIGYSSVQDQKRYISAIYQNGSRIKTFYTVASGTTNAYCSLSAIVYLDANDYVEIWTYHDATASQSLDGQSLFSDFSVHLLSV